jgi:hypothetical protein
MMRADLVALLLPSAHELQARGHAQNRIHPLRCELDGERNAMAIGKIDQLHELLKHVRIIRLAMNRKKRFRRLRHGEVRKTKERGDQFFHKDPSAFKSVYVMESGMRWQFYCHSAFGAEDSLLALWMDESVQTSLILCSFENTAKEAYKVS